MRGPGVRTRAGLLAAVALVVGLRVGAAPAEQCPPVTATDSRDAAERAVAWFAASQRDDGSFLYLSDDDGRDLGSYNAVRHAGVVMSLEQAAAAGIAEARPVADRGRAWALERLRPAGEGRALADLDGSIRTGASALLLSSLVLRGDADPALVRDLATFLVGQVDGQGAVLASWDRAEERPTGAPNPFFTGEAYWALLEAREHVAGGAAAATIDGAVERIGRYLPVRDDVEGRFPPLSDHWAAYAYNRLGWDALTDAQRDHADRMSALFGVQVRGESTRWKGGLQGVLRGGPAGGSGLGTLGEGTGNLLQLYGDDAPSGLAERLQCVAGMLVARQAGDGAWYTDGVTRMDDQQHALSALLFSADVLGARAADAVGGGEQSHGTLWLLAIGLALGAVAGAARGDGRRSGVGGLGIAAFALIVWSGPLLDVLDISPASARAAAGIGAAMAALGVLVAPTAAAVRGIVAAGALVLALGLGADDGIAAVVPLVLAAVVATAWPRARGSIAARVAGAGLLVLAVDLIVDGILGV